MPDATYYALRAREERERAASATDREVANVHAELARRYEALIASADDDAAPPTDV